MKSTVHRKFSHIIVIVSLLVIVLPLGVTECSGRMGQLFYNDPPPGDIKRAILAPEPERLPDSLLHLPDTFWNGRKPKKGNVNFSLPIIPAYASYLTQDSSVADRLLAYAHGYLGSPYRFGGKGPKYFDCAGFSRFVFLHFGHTLGSGCASQWNQGRPVARRNAVHKGDLVFFGDRHIFTLIGHVGIVNSVEGNKFTFIHASTSAGVIISSSSEPYYAERLIGIRRILNNEDILPSPKK
ncbi:MAG: C40 family peptidase [Bacteroidales bacterium]|nr:C40 family peptidase [Bacteroidales bacterium]